MGRLVHCQETCSHMKDFKESVGNIFDRCMQTGYPRRLVQSVWSRFLIQRWHSTDIRVKELLRHGSQEYGAFCCSKDMTVAPNQRSPPKQVLQASSLKSSVFRAQRKLELLPQRSLPMSVFARICPNCPYLP